METTTATAPTLTEAQQLRLQNAVQRIAICQLRGDVVRLEQEQASAAFQAVIDSVTIDLTTYTYVKAE